MALIWDKSAWADYLWWQAQDRKVLKRITAEHHLVYRIDDTGNILVAACRYHYE
ncbi:type II toxin-antitoxin system YoeB family toxin [Actinomyces trachealis]|uniref:type II toxin-antitoxin system YoeB family toxin n=1 Tax=Actinomyces trachealis TaxID=2763540 RepID=UPI001892C0EB|nr:type II toxin-antitoxin system YoeB family toxin [Actinomyces trachealis]